MDDLENQLSEFSEKMGKTLLYANKAMTEFMESDAIKSIVNFFNSIPKDIQETELSHHVQQLKKPKITYAEIEWLQETIGYKSLKMSIKTLQEKENKSELDKYVLSIIEADNMSPREKTVVLLAHFEALVYQTIDFERKNKEKVKNVISDRAKCVHEMESGNYRKILLAGIVFIVFSNTDSYKNQIDKRIPFRNNILHRGTMAYSDDDINEAYEILVYFIAALTLLEE